MNVVPISTKSGRAPKQSPEVLRNVFARKFAATILVSRGAFNINMFLRSVLCLPMLLLPLIVAKAGGMNTDLFLGFVMSIILGFHFLLLVAAYADTFFCLRAHNAVVRENRELMIQIEASRGDLWRQVDEERQSEVRFRHAA